MAGLFYAVDLAAGDSGPGQAEMLYDAATLGGVGCATASGLWWLYARVRLPRGRAGLWSGALIGALVGALVWFIVLHALDEAFHPFRPADSPLTWNPGDLLATFLLYFFPMLVWHGAALTQRELDRAGEAERLAQTAQLQALRYQLNPHLLFNALNSAIALIDEEPGRARTMLARLSGLLRHTLREVDGDSTLGRELDIVREYVEIEKVRFEDKLEVGFSVAEDLNGWHVPPLLLHSLVENAIKHGMTTSVLPLQVQIATTRNADGVSIEVSNTGRLESTTGGIGLDNVRRRLEARYPGHHRFTLAEVDGKVRAQVFIQRVAGAT